MSPARHRRLMELFEQAASLPARERSTLLARVRAESPTLAGDLRALLAEDGTRDDFLDSHDGRLRVALAPRDEPTSTAAADDAGPDPLLGSEVAGRYRLDEPLGAGGMGRVYRAFDRAEARDVAVKLLRADLIHDARQVERFRREFRAVSRLSHPGCLSVFAEGCHERQRFIVMEYLPGGNLDRLIGAPSEVLLPVLIQLVTALDYVHSRRILHRDLKPANVLLTAGDLPIPKLADFGIVQMLDEAASRITDTGAVLGTLDFMAPEQLEGEALDPRCDLYALGCVIYTLWAAAPPFSGSVFHQLRARVEREAPSLRERARGVPARLDALVARLLRRDRAERPQHAGEVAIELSRVLTEESGGVVSAPACGALAAPRRGAYLYRPGFVGRAPFVDALVAKVEEAALAPRAELIVVEGAAGLGKSAVVQALSRRLARGGLRVLTIACRRDDLSPFALFSRGLAVLEEALGAVDPLGATAKLAPASAREGHGQARSLLPTDHAVVARRQLAGALADKLLALARRAPVVLVVEDLHHAAGGAVDLLHDLLEALDRADGRRPVLVATARPAWRERLDAAPSARERIARRPLDRLAPAGVRQIAAEMLAIEPTDVPEPLAAELVEECDGNPLWVQSAVRTLVDRGHLRLAASGWILDGAELSSILHVAIADLLRAELAGLASSTRAVLAVAALIAGAFDIDLLCQVAGVGEDTALDAVDEAARAAVVRSVRGRSANAQYAFAHDLLAEVLKRDVPAPERAAIHDAIGAALSRRGTASAATLAYHLARGTDRERAFHALRRAGLAAFDAHDYEVAARLLGEAMERVDSLAEGSREAARAGCAEALADALVALGRTREGIDLLRQLGAGPAPPTTRSRWLRKLGVAQLRTPAVAEGLAALESALALLGDPVPSLRRRRLRRLARDVALASLRRLSGARPDHDAADEERAVIHRELALIHRWIDLERAGFHHVAFIRLAYRLGADAYLVEAHIGAAFLFALRSWPRLAAFFFGKARAVSLGAGDRHGLSRLEIVRAGIELLTGRDEGATISRFAEGVRGAEALGDRFLLNFALTMRGWAGLLLGRVGQAKEDFARAGALAAELDVTWLREDAACGRSLVELLHGELETAERAARGVLSSDTRLALPVFEALPNEILGAEAFLSGRFREAVSYFERARTHYAAHHLNRAWGTLAKLFHSEALLCLADEEGGPATRELLEQLRRNVRLARRMSRLHVFRGCGLLMTGVYRARRGDARAARALFARALAERGAARETSYIELWFKVRIAIELLRLGEPRASVAATLDGAEEAYRALGLGGVGTWLARMRQALRV